MAAPNVNAAILGSVKLYDPKADLATFVDGHRFTDGRGNSIDIIA